MHTRSIRIDGLGLVTIRPLRNGDTYTIAAYLNGDSEPAGTAQLVRDRTCWRQAEIAFAVADGYHSQRMSSALVECLAADARAAGITHVTASCMTAREPTRS